MLTLLLMRHAKSAEQQPGSLDFERPLTDRGRKDAARMGRLLAEKRLTPALIVSSAAERTKQTVNSLINELSYPGDVFFYNELYEANFDSYIAALSHLDQPEASPVLLVGHNPTVQEFILSVCSQSEIMNTATIAHIQLDLSNWGALHSDSEGKLVAVWRPKELE